MSIKFACEHCGHHIEVGDQFHGKHGTCKHCGQPMTVPERLTVSSEQDHPMPRPEPVAALAEGALRLRPLETDEPERVNANLLAKGAPLSIKPSEEAPRSKPKAISDPDQAQPTPSGRWRALLAETQSNLYKVIDPYGIERQHSSAGPPPGWMLIPTQIARVIARFFLTIRNWLYLVSVIGLAIALFGYLFSSMNVLHVGATIVIATNIGMLVVGVAYLVSLPFKESFHHGLANLLIPFYAIYYWSTRWHKMRRPVVNTLGSFLPIALIGLAYVVFEERGEIQEAIDNPAAVGKRLEERAERAEERLKQKLEQLEGRPKESKPDDEAP